MNSEVLQACDHVVAGAVNGIYQGIIIAVLAGLGLRLLRRTNAATRDAALLATLIVVAALIPAHCLRDYIFAEPLGGSESSKVEGSVLKPERSSSPLVPVAGGAEQGVRTIELMVVLPDDSGTWIISPALLSPAPAETTGALEKQGQRAQTALVGATAKISGASTDLIREILARAGKILRPSSWSFAPGSHIPRWTSLVLLSAWFGLAAVKSGLLLWRLREIRKLKAQAMPAGQGLLELFGRLRHELAVRRNAQLKVSRTNCSAVLLGFFRPVVLLPALQTTDTEATEAILRHELAHVRRRDDWANLLQHAIQAALFFHPAVWWICRQLSIQREIACDDYVLHQGARARTYALLLADLASRLKMRRPLLAPGVTTSKSQLQKRIDMILNTRRDTSPRLAKSRLGFITLGTTLLASLAFYAAPRLVLAQAPPAALAAPPAPLAPPAPPTPEAAVLNEIPAPAPYALEPGPKVKSPDSIDRVPQPPRMARPALPAPPALAVPADPIHAPYVVAVPRPAAAPRPPRSADIVARDAHLEERLSRLERMVESLVEQKDPKHVPNRFEYKEFKAAPQPRVRVERQELKAWAELQAEQAKRAAREAETAMKLQQDAHSKLKENTGKHIEALHKERAALEREVEKLRRQIERLQQEQEKLQQEQEHRSGDLMKGEAVETERKVLLEETAAGHAAMPAK